MYEVLIKSDSRYPMDRKKLRGKLVDELWKFKLDGNVEVSVAIVGSRKMKALNKKYRNLDQATNVLSFPLVEGNMPIVSKHTSSSAVAEGLLSRGEFSPFQEGMGGFVYPENGKLYLGDIVICYSEARRQAGKYGMLVDEWIGDLAVHGLEHLLGKHHDLLD